MADAFLTRCAPGPGSGPLLAVKDLIDVAGLPTTAGCRAVAARAVVAARDASCVAAMRAAGARVVGKTALNELAAGANGVNAWFGTPVNPLDPNLVPGGSSSGSAVAVATGEADLALGSDTGGSVRIPAACCGITGLKTTMHTLATDRVMPLAPSLDTIGPLARDVAGLIEAMAMLAPGFAPAGFRGRLWRLRGLPEHPSITAAVDAALAAAGLSWRVAELAGWRAAAETNRRIIVSEAAVVHTALLRDDPAGISAPIRSMLFDGLGTGPDERAALARARVRWRSELLALLDDGAVLALPTLLAPPPALGPPATPGSPLTAATAPVNLAGLPALALPVRWPPGVTPASRVPASLQLVAGPGAEGLLLGLGRLIETAAGIA